MQKELGLSGRVGCSLAAIAVLLLPVPLLFGKIDVETFLAVETVWMLVAGVLILGPDTISKISFGQASIERNRRAAELARDEAKEIRDQVRDIARTIVENSYILGSVGPIASSGGSPAAIRFAENMDRIWTLVEPDPRVAHYARQEVRALFGHPPQPYVSKPA